jgi:drug efflux transport system permease protein
MSIRRMLAMARKEAIQLKRDRRSMILAFVLPMMLIIVFGYAISFDVNNIELAVLDESHSAESRQLIDSFQSSGYFRVAHRLDDYGEIEGLLDRGQVRMVLVVPPGFASAIHGPEPAALQVVLDGSDANTATIALGYTEAILGGYIERVVLRGVEVVPPVSAESRVWYNETLRSVNMIVPGLIAVIMSIIASLLTALTIAREWERGTMEQLAATPVARSEIITGKLLPYVAIGVIDVALAVAAGVWLFDVPMRGSLLLLSCMTMLFLIGALGLGMFISAALKTQVLATQVAMLASYLPALLLSGFMFSIANMPLPLRVFTHLVSARYFIVVTRGIFLKGVGISVLWPQAVAMVIFAVVGITAATRMLKKEVSS